MDDTLPILGRGCARRLGRIVRVVNLLENGCSGFCSDLSGFRRAIVFPPARLKSLELNWRSPPGRRQEIGVQVCGKCS